MIKKRNKFLTFLFALFPGAGQMFMGFFKLGVCLMGAFLLLCFLSSWLHIGALIYITPVLWFYSFFDAINKMYLSDAEFYSLEDHYLFALDSIESTRVSSFFKKNKLYFGIALIVLGAYLLLAALPDLLLSCDILAYGSVAASVLSAIAQLLPQVCITALIIFLGIRLIISKKAEDERGNNW